MPRPRFRLRGGVADQPVGLDSIHQEVEGAADVVSVLALAEGAALAEKRHAAQGRHRDGILAVGPLPMSIPELALRQPLEALLDRLAIFPGELLLHNAAWRSRQQ